jgi:hypothetical protein
LKEEALLLALKSLLKYAFYSLKARNSPPAGGSDSRAFWAFGKHIFFNDDFQTPEKIKNVYG